MEDTGDAMAELIEESERQSGYWLVDLFKKLPQLAKRWHAVMANVAALAGRGSEATQPSSSPAELR